MGKSSLVGWQGLEDGPACLISISPLYTEGL